MGLASVAVLAVGLAMDATAVSAARGFAVPALRPAHFAKVALYFGGAQALMPLIGYLVGERFGRYVEAWDHWIAFALLAGLGLKMLHEARSAGTEEIDVEHAFGGKVMLLLAIATSIDALAAGLTLPLLGAPIVASLTTIGLTTAVLSAVGLYLGRRFGAALGRRLDAFGGVVLILLGLKVLVEHLSA